MNARVITAPEVWEPDDRHSLFLAGGITGTPNWQQQAIELLGDLDGLALLNPRREDFPIEDPNAALDQIEWEYTHLEVAHARLFWFPCETLCPIALFELGRWSSYDLPLFVGTHPDYQRRLDVVIQLKLARPDVTVHSSVEDLCGAVRAAWR